MKPQRKAPWFWHFGSLVLLAVLQAHSRARRSFNHSFLRVVGIFLGIGLVVAVASSLLALNRVARSVNTLIGDSFVGIESSISLRALVRDTHQAVLRLKPGDVLPAGDVHAFELNARRLLLEYNEGAYDSRDQSNAKAMRSGLQAYLGALTALSESGSTTTRIRQADETALALTAAIEAAYQFNRLNARNIAQEADNTVRMAIQTAQRLWWSIAIALLCFLLAVLAYRALALPEETDD